ncbi:hypothetical protein RHS04_07820 [Rhizoctonia solani]|uniref:Uncharacterized protein n=1 Tax=Rhizoctonia solani TaxID=456999 RepID=A0A8H7H3C3_9AGAM|nr:hypothetical protein RHS04_07820 [Rhizoctonia solani]
MFDNAKSAANHRSRCKLAKEYDIQLLDSLYKIEPPAKQRQTSIGDGIADNMAQQSVSNTGVLDFQPVHSAEFDNCTINPPSNLPTTKARSKAPQTATTLNSSRSTTCSQTCLLRSGFRLANDALPEGPAPKLTPAVDEDPCLDNTPKIVPPEQEQEQPTPSVGTPTGSKLPVGTYISKPDIFGHPAKACLFS